jgi:predicted RNA binding protein YcfA (HicA-like mRNA interferase family)
MTKLPRVSGRECVKCLLIRGFEVKRQRGTHIILQREEPFSLVVLPDHKELDRGTLRSILRQADIDPEEFQELL